MAKIICYTFNEFNSKYPTLLGTFLSEWEDNTEKDFLVIQEKLYKECINNTTIKHRKDLSIEQLEFLNVEPVSSSLKDIQHKISESIFYYYHVNENPLYHDTFRLRVKDIDLCDKYNRSFNMILESIQNKIQEIEIYSNDRISLENSLNLTAKEHRQFEAVKPDEVLKNNFDNIFKNDIGFTIFTKMFKLYNNETNHLANFSFLFHAMEKDFLVCSQTEFREFLRNNRYNIEIEKIDSRQSGKNKKAQLYNSIKEKYQPNTIKAQ